MAQAKTREECIPNKHVIRIEVDQPKPSKIKFDEIHASLHEKCGNVVSDHNKYSCHELKQLMFCAKNTFLHPHDSSIREYCERTENKFLDYPHWHSNHHISDLMRYSPPEKVLDVCSEFLTICMMDMSMVRKNNNNSLGILLKDLNAIINGLI